MHRGEGFSRRPAIALVRSGGLTPIRSEFERLRTPADVAAWLSSIFDTPMPASVSNRDLADAIALREAIFQTIRRRTVGKTPEAADVDVINGAARAAPVPLAIDERAREVRLVAPYSVRAALSTIARDAIAMFTGTDGDRVRECANPWCELVFVDHSPPGQRRWCSMDKCGNRRKVSTYRARKRSAAAR